VGLSQAARAQTSGSAPYRVGDRVEWNIGEIWYKGTIYNAQDGQYQVERDGYGRAREWVTAANLKHLTPPRAEAPPAPPQGGAAIQRSYRVGDRVEWKIGEIWYKGAIYNAQDDQYQVERDGYGRAREWVTPADLRRLAPERAQATTRAADAQQSARGGAAPAVAGSRYRPGDRVEINVDGTWYAASVASVQDDRYRVQRDDHTFGVSSTGEWVSPARLRPLVTKPAASRPVAGLPNAVPAGLYSCTLFGSGNTAGKLRILNGTTSSGVTPDGGGPQHQFTYDPASGVITWAGGLQIFSWTVEQASYGPDAKGVPNINLHYRLRAGGNLNSMGCRRE
jgi:hypothetical protein